MDKTKNMVGLLVEKWFDLLEFFKHFFLLAIRLYWGYSFMMTGRGKFLNFDATVEYFQTLNIPMPAVNAAMASGTEFIGGICLLLGLGSRFITVPLTFTMIVAYATAERDTVLGIFTDPEPFFAAAPFLFLYSCLVILFFGAGKISLDYLISRK